MSAVPVTLDPRLDLSQEKDQLWITLNDPATKNALDEKLTSALASAIEESSSPILVITGKNGAFSSGGRLDVVAQLAERAESHPAEVEHLIRKGGNLIEDIVFTPEISVAVVDGVCAGAGLGIALACDYLIATPRSRFVTAYKKLRLTSDYGTHELLKLRIGPEHADQLMAESPTILAKEAEKMGLVDTIIDNPERKTIKRFLKEVTRRATVLELPGDFSARLDREAQDFVSALRHPKARTKIAKALKRHNLS